jgi:hypothetical protein
MLELAAPAFRKMPARGLGMLGALGEAAIRQDAVARRTQRDMAAIGRHAIAGIDAQAYLTDLFFDRSVVSIGLSSEKDARFDASEGIPTPEPES